MGTCNIGILVDFSRVMRGDTSFGCKGELGDDINYFFINIDVRAVGVICGLRNGRHGIIISES